MTDVYSRWPLCAELPVLPRGSRCSESRSVNSRLSVVQRLSNVVFGSPSMVRANGGRHTTLCAQLSNGFVSRDAAKTAPVYQLDMQQKKKASRLPRIWISEPSFDFESGEQNGRSFVAAYPCDNDECGTKAFQHGLNYFSEALGYSGSGNEHVKAECFRAAEILFRHAFVRGCSDAAVKLGLIYEYDLCAGSYLEAEFGDEGAAQLFLEAKAVEYYSVAASAGDSEALRRLGSMVASGRGCKCDKGRAFELFLQAHRAADDLGDCANRGYAALRIACAREGGEGCRQSFREAYRWYRDAELDLSYIVSEGAWHYKKPKHQASLGVRRMRQELLGGC